MVLTGAGPCPQMASCGDIFHEAIGQRERELGKEGVNTETHQRTERPIPRGLERPRLHSESGQVYKTFSCSFSRKS